MPTQLMPAQPVAASIRKRPPCMTLAGVIPRGGTRADGLHLVSGRQAQHHWQHTAWLPGHSQEARRGGEGGEGGSGGGGVGEGGGLQGNAVAAILHMNRFELLHSFTIQPYGPLSVSVWS